MHRFPHGQCWRARLGPFIVGILLESPNQTLNKILSDVAQVLGSGTAVYALILHLFSCSFVAKDEIVMYFKARVLDRPCLEFDIFQSKGRGMS